MNIVHQTSTLTSLVFRPIHNNYKSQYYKLLCEFKNISSKDVPLDQNKYDRFITDISNNPNHHIYIGVIDEEVICSGTLLVEPKAIRNFSKAGHIEDVVVFNKHSRKGYGKALIQFLTNKAKEEGCYKVILNCSLQNVPFYNKCGYQLTNQEMAIYF